MKEGKMLKVFISCEKLPKATAQQKGVSIAKNGKPHFYEKKKVTNARNFYADAIRKKMKQAGWETCECPVSVRMNFVFTQKTKPKTEFKTTRPDLDNLMKLILDAATDAGAWRDDALIVEIAALKKIAQSTPAHPANEMLLLIIEEIACDEE